MRSVNVAAWSSGLMAVRRIKMGPDRGTSEPRAGRTANWAGIPPLPGAWMSAMACGLCLALTFPPSVSARWIPSGWPAALATGGSDCDAQLVAHEISLIMPHSGGPASCSKCHAAAASLSSWPTPSSRARYWTSSSPRCGSAVPRGKFALAFAWCFPMPCIRSARID